MLLTLFSAAICVTLAQHPPVIPVEKPGLVAILPLLNNTGESWDKLKTGYIKLENSFFADDLKSRGFTFVPEDKIEAILKSENMDFQNEDERLRSNFYAAADKIGCDYVIQVVIADATQDDVKMGVLQGGEAGIRIKCWFLDAKRHTPIVRGTYYSERVETAFGPGSDKKIRAFELALRDAFTDPVKKLPKEKDGR